MAKRKRRRGHADQLPLREEVAAARVEMEPTSSVDLPVMSGDSGDLPAPPPDFSGLVMAVPARSASAAVDPPPSASSLPAADPVPSAADPTPSASSLPAADPTPSAPSLAAVGDPDPRTDPAASYARGAVRQRLARFSTPVPIARASTTPPPPARVPPPVRPPPSPIELAPGTEITGDLLRQLREQRGVTLKEIEDVTRVRAASLAAVEAERFADLPDVKIYIRGFVQALARTIGVDVEQAANSYLARWERWRERTPTPKRHFIK